MRMSSFHFITYTNRKNIGRILFPQKGVIRLFFTEKSFWLVIKSWAQNDTRK